MKRVTMLSLMLMAMPFAQALPLNCQDWLEQGVLFCDDFEQEPNALVDNRLAWKPAYDPKTAPHGMMYGEGDVYQRALNNGFYSVHGLQIDFAGRNNMCNECGFDFFEVGADKDGNSFYLKSGEDLTQAPYLQPDSSRAIYNVSDRFSKWQVTGLYSKHKTNDALSATLVQNAMRGKGQFQDGDKIAIARQCGLNGRVGGDIHRRSDCNSAVNWLQNFDSDMHKPGETLFVRYYFYVATEAVVPDITVKLNYFRPEKAPNGHTEQVAVIYAAGENTTPRANTLATFGGLGMHDGIKSNYTSDIKFEKGHWYYVEQAYTSSTTESSLDGRYRYWINKITYDPITQQMQVPEFPEAQFDITGFNLSSVRKFGGLAIPGNWPHYNTISGFMYLDNVVVSNARIGNR